MLLLTFGTPMLAYLGPGGALSGLGAILSLAGAVLLAIIGFLWYPMKRWLRSRRASSAPDAGSTTQEDPQA